MQADMTSPKACPPIAFPTTCTLVFTRAENPHADSSPQASIDLSGALARDPRAHRACRLPAPRHRGRTLGLRGGAFAVRAGGFGRGYLAFEKPVTRALRRVARIERYEIPDGLAIDVTRVSLRLIVSARFARSIRRSANPALPVLTGSLTFIDAGFPRFFACGRAPFAAMFCCLRHVGTTFCQCLSGAFHTLADTKYNAGKGRKTARHFRCPDARQGRKIAMADRKAPILPLVEYLRIVRLSEAARLAGQSERSLKEKISL